MRDLYLALLIMIALSAGMFALGAFTAARAARAARRRAVTLTILVLLLLIFFATSLWDSLLMARLLPFSSAVVLGNWIPPLTALLAGLTWSLLRERRQSRLVLVPAILLVAVIKSYAPLNGAPPPPLRDRWAGDACVQTSDSSCSAAAAATLLRAHSAATAVATAQSVAEGRLRESIAATEREMAELCLTRRTCTTMLGLYRGLKLKTAGTRWDVQPFAGSDALLRLPGGRPVLIAVGLPAGGAADRRFGRDYGWSNGARHTVVLFGYSGDGKVDVADPSVGREQWFSRDLTVLYRGQGLRLVPKGPAAGRGSDRSS